VSGGGNGAGVSGNRASGSGASGAERGASSAGIVVFTDHGVPALRTVLRGIRETVEDPWDLVVFANDAPEQVATYLVRQYLRGRISGFQLESGDAHGHHCGLDRAFRLVEGDYLVRVDDTLEFEPGWLERAIAALDADPSIGCLSLVAPSDYHRGRGRPRTVHVEPVPVERLDMRCFVTRHDLVSHHECELMGEEHGEACVFQKYLCDSGRTLAYLPGLVTALEHSEVPRGQDACAHEADLPAHEGASGAMQRLQQEYDLGDDVLLTCMACGATELEVLAARIRFCEAHQVAIGYWYELRCPECNELHYKDDYQFSCPG